MFCQIGKDKRQMILKHVVRIGEDSKAVKINLWAKTPLQLAY